eukprot:NODE_21479_length_751_cov_3.256410.p3 GENE.NODE_21479_length_751_cov_3.256410~~NODE_21479_length_751_cov_3.256410.p3  ORF type:complete len:96 (-),score=8.84 NODE_21479_length_751_cov_3.256410:63-350(-)
MLLPIEFTENGLAIVGPRTAQSMDDNAVADNDNGARSILRRESCGKQCLHQRLVLFAVQGDHVILSSRQLVISPRLLDLLRILNLSAAFGQELLQ